MPTKYHNLRRNHIKVNMKKNPERQKLMKGSLVILIVISNALQEQLTHSYEPVFIAEIIAEGAKTPEGEQIKDDLAFVEKYGQDSLTPNGERMMYILGQRVSRTYPKIFDKTYNHKRVNVYASSRHSSQASARSHLIGLYEKADNTKITEISGKGAFLTMPPLNGVEVEEERDTALPHGYKPFVLDIEEDSEDFMFVSHIHRVCPKAARKITETSRKHEGDLITMSSLMGKYLTDRGLLSTQYFRGQLGWSPSNLNYFYQIVHSHFYETASILDKMSEDEFARLKVYHGMYLNAHQFSNFNYTRVFTHRIAETFLKQMSDKVLDETKDLEFSLFSADESNLMAFISAMRKTSFTCLKDRFIKNYETIACFDPPEFGDSLIFELVLANSVIKKDENKVLEPESQEDEYEYNQWGERVKKPKTLKKKKILVNKDIPIDDEYYVRMTYNGEPLIFCETDYNFDTYYCPFSKFVETAQDYFMISGFETLCGNQEIDVQRIAVLKKSEVVYKETGGYLIWGNVGLAILILLSWLFKKFSTMSLVKNSIEMYENNNFGGNGGDLPGGRGPDRNLQTLETQGDYGYNQQERDTLDIQQIDQDETFEGDGKESTGRGVLVSDRLPEIAQYTIKQRKLVDYESAVVD